MQENEFEKQVHEKMEGLKFQPSAAVWQEVESKLRKRKKRRYLFIWLPVYVAALLFAGYFIWPHHVPGKTERPLPALAKNNPEGKKYTSSKDNQDKSKTGDKNVPVDDLINAGAIPNADTHTGNAISNRQPGSKAVVSGGMINKKSLAGRLNKKPGRFFVAESKPVTKQSPIVEQQGAAPQFGIVKSGTTQKDLLSATQPLPAQETQDAVTREMKYANINPELIGNDPINTSLALENFSKTSPVTLTRISRKRPWQLGITFEGGRSGLSNGQFNSIFRAADPAGMLNYSAPSTPSAPASNMYIPPSALKQGHAFSPGLYLKKQLNKRLALSIGINYALYTSSYQVGQKADSIIIPQANLADQRQFAGLFRTGSNLKYINRYHFIELPVLLRTKLAGRRETGLSWDVGFSISRLVSTNALFYDSRAGLYYKDNSLFNKTQLNFVTALPINFYSSRKISFIAGPQFQYGFTKFSSEKNNATHLVFLGLKAGILLK